MASILASIFSPEAPEAKLKRWKTATRTQTRSIDSQIRTLGVQKQKAAVQIRAYLRNKDTQNARLLASALIKLNRTLERLHTTKAHLNSVQMQIDHQIASVKVMGAFALGAEVMHKWNVGGVGEVGRVMREVGVEMMKNGLIQEMVEDAMDLNDDADVEEADEEVCFEFLVSAVEIAIYLVITYLGELGNLHALPKISHLSEFHRISLCSSMRDTE